MSQRKSLPSIPHVCPLCQGHQRCCSLKTTFCFYKNLPSLRTEGGPILTGGRWSSTVLGLLQDAELNARGWNGENNCSVVLPSGGSSSCRHPQVLCGTQVCSQVLCEHGPSSQPSFPLQPLPPSLCHLPSLGQSLTMNLRTQV